MQPPALARQSCARPALLSGSCHTARPTSTPTPSTAALDPFAQGLIFSLFEAAMYPPLAAALAPGGEAGDAGVVVADFASLVGVAWPGGGVAVAEAGCAAVGLLAVVGRTGLAGVCGLLPAD
jgi:hypothetical protein